MSIFKKLTRGNSEESLEKKRQKMDAAVEVENLVVQYVTSSETVEAVNGISWRKSTPWAWWGRPAPEKPPPCWP